METMKRELKDAFRFAIFIKAGGKDLTDNFPV